MALLQADRILCVYTSFVNAKPEKVYPKTKQIIFDLFYYYFDWIKLVIGTNFTFIKF